MRKPLNRLTFRNNHAGRPAEQPMLNPNLRLRYDRSPLADLCASGESPDLDFDADPGEPDMDVTGANAVGGALPIRPAQLAPAQGASATSASGLAAPQDEVQISSAARALGQLEQTGQIHEARLAEIRAAIADGTYETAEKLEAAVDKLMQAIRSRR
jgi:negative regulator of flagellin synthesis FlgM